MTNEEMQRNMEFIVSQQAHFAADIQQLKEAQVQAEARMTRIEGALVMVVDLVGQLARRLETTATQIAELVETQKRTDEALAETNDRLNSFITFVERYISGRANGHQPPA